MLQGHPPLNCQSFYVPTMEILKKTVISYQLKGLSDGWQYGRQRLAFLLVELVCCIGIGGFICINPPSSVGFGRPTDGSWVPVKVRIMTHNKNFTPFLRHIPFLSWSIIKYIFVSIIRRLWYFWTLHSHVILYDNFAKKSTEEWLMVHV